jgi:hypothetical protein
MGSRPWFDVTWHVSTNVKAKPRQHWGLTVYQKYIYRLVIVSKSLFWKTKQTQVYSQSCSSVLNAIRPDLEYGMKDTVSGTQRLHVSGAGAGRKTDYVVALMSAPTETSLFVKRGHLHHTESKKLQLQGRNDVLLLTLPQTERDPNFIKFHIRMYTSRSKPKHISREYFCV